MIAPLLHADGLINECSSEDSSSSEHSRSECTTVDQFIVSHGKSGVIGVFTLVETTTILRGNRVLVQSSRGIEVGTVLGPASIHQARLFGATSTGTLLRTLTHIDQTHIDDLKAREQGVFDSAVVASMEENLDIDILDVDLFFDGKEAIVQFLGSDDGVEKLAHRLEEQLGLTLRFENLAMPAPKDEHKCDKPDCGRDAGGCTSCSTGGGCSSCGSSKVDMREYFGHLRTKMEKKRIPLT
jgi:hypothetical protein